ncbi:hypothetical protein GXW83_17555 [Streptacidiphilus sp. PB12-B1b]|uniref:hypothetical protein n=1 Tax=Streptacidiphilus sp. PB12-B1b TaxID=2705012 RepID=UPI0015FC2F8A|nr:hypothetical protein [Streptacidiphilus sp. PB12-B1b]QMU74404.1 hypothetical protein GXW83_17555 [Streptacidiphilus sp. PB12-B1b]
MTTHKRANSETRPHGPRRNNRLRSIAAAAALTALTVAGCASTNATGSAAPGAAASTGVPTAPGAATAPRMSMSPGMQMPGTATQAAGPSASAVLVCGSEIKQDVTAILALSSAPATTTTWTDHVYTCTYHLPAGPLVLSVKESPDATTATAYFQALRKQLGTTKALTMAQALGNPGYESAGGATVVLKDGKTLQVDATGMPAASGPNQLSRADLSYEVATDILGCWSE